MFTIVRGVKALYEKNLSVGAEGESVPILK